MPLARDLPGPLETRLAYLMAMLASFAWVACVMPGVILDDPTLPDDLASPMLRGAIYLVPALLLLVAVPIAVVLSRQALALRSLIAWSGAFVAGYTAAALAATRPRGFGWAVVVVLAVVTVFSVRDAVRIARAANVEDDVGGAAPRTADVRLALSLLALLTPAAVLSSATDERATWLVPFVFLALGAAGERFATGFRVLRLCAVLSLFVLAAHLVVGIRYALSQARPAATAWTGWGTAAFVLACAVLAVVAVWTLLLAVRRGERPAAAPSTRAPQGPAGSPLETRA